MELIIENIFCYESLNVEIPRGPVLITGENSTGKTSLARILACLTSHNQNPAGLSGAATKAYVRDGAVEGMASLGGVVWQPPSGLAVPTGIKPIAPPHAVGLVKFMSGRSANERAKVWEGMFLPEDPEPILEPVWNLPKNQLFAVLKTIRDEGWEEAQKIYHGQALASRRQWEDITGERYGIAKASQWKPKSWETDLDGLSEDDVRSAITNANDALRQLGVKQAVEQDRVDRGVEARDNTLPIIVSTLADKKAVRQPIIEEVGSLRKDRAELTQDFERAKSNMNAQSSKARGIKNGILEMQDDKSLPCPHCGEGLQVQQGKVVAYSNVVDPETIASEKEKLSEIRKVFDSYKVSAEALSKKIKVVTEQLLERQEEVGRQSAKISELEGQLNMVERTAKDADLTASAGTDEAERSRLENIRDAAIERMKAWMKQRDAKRSHENYVEQNAVVKLLSPTGARALYMKKHMDRVRSVLANITKRTGWRPITVTQGYEYTSGGRPVQLIAANEQWKVQVALQVACAMLTRWCQWLVIDAADLLRDGSWDGLVTLVDLLKEKRPHFHIVVCATSTAVPEGWNLIDLDD